MKKLITALIFLLLVGFQLHQEKRPIIPEQNFYANLTVVDGDTVKSNGVTYRIIGIDTPETKKPNSPVECYGPEATNAAKEFLDGPVNVFIDGLDRYNRKLAYLVDDEKGDFGKYMILNGFAESYKNFDHPKLEEYNFYERMAQSNNLGIWKHCK